MEKIVNLCHHLIMMINSEKHTIIGTLKKGRDILKSAGIDTFDIDAKVLLSFVTGIPHHEFITNPDIVITFIMYRKYMCLIRRRAKYEPVAQITGEKEFWSLPFKVSKGTLIPRPESETIIEAVKSEFKNQTIKYHILDMGTGTGCLLLSILSEYKNADGIGIDVRHNPIKTARENAKKLALQDRAKIMKLSWYSKKPIKKIMEQKFHIIVSNPPYITECEMKKLADDVRIYEHKQALYGGRDGLDEYRQISKALYYWDILDDNGKIFLEIGKGQHDDVRKIFEAFGFKFKHYFNDIAGVIRVVEFSKK